MVYDHFVGGLSPSSLRRDMINMQSSKSMKYFKQNMTNNSRKESMNKADKLNGIKNILPFLGQIKINVSSMMNTEWIKIMKGKTMVISSLDINVLDILIDRIEIILDKEILIIRLISDESELKNSEID